MGQRLVRVGELIQRELSQYLHSRHRSEAVAITITGVDVAADLKRATVYYSVFGNRLERAKAGKFLMSIRNEMRGHLGKNVIIKYTPELYFSYDESVERGMHIVDLLDELDEEDTAREESEEYQDDAQNE